ncbi:hypothetical protein GCM10010387_08210 [Streptomyces inusitatus]|uniref:DUF3344 domain-containing protein n=1 Tax=Streptomyces inusitatus TaxID=68221 RepID=A0A918PRR2_9ACTN|nr:DUF3344 domain-containing protein [Streptomyces inusitatus]GGZ18136.1 hypothetical protein GCM10010387_08210 [Streptomyces inusitatus]
MPKPTGLTARGVLGAVLLLALSAVTLSAPPHSAAASQASPVSAPLAVDVSGQPESERIPFAQRYQAVHHGGIVRAANSSITCTSPTSTSGPSCTSARSGDGVNSDFEMYYIDQDDDPNTYNSSRARLAIPSNSTVTYARLYWGGNLLAGEQKPPEDNGRVLIAEQGGQYQQVLADTRIAHRDADGADAFQASADITPLVRRAGSGLYTVAQINVAMGNSTVGAWGGWTLVVAYENSTEPLRHLSLWDGFEALGTDRKSQEISLSGLRVPAGAKGRAGFVSYDGDRGEKGDAVSVRADGAKAFGLTDTANPATDVMNSTITGPEGAISRQPAHSNTLGYDSDVFDIGPALTAGGTRLTFLFDAGTGGYGLGVLFAQTDTRR